MKSEVARFIGRRWAVPPGEVRVDVRPMHGGLESAVARATVAVRGRTGIPRRLVVKELRGSHRREAAVYESLWSAVEQPPAAEVLGVEPAGDSHYLFLEYVERESAWPWPDSTVTRSVCRALARIHDAPALAGAVLDWDYESELRESARETLAVAASARDANGVRIWRRFGDLKRIVDALPDIRGRLLASDRTVIHGDVHPGNVIVRPGGGERRVALIDWGRARVGSPLEDIASWLHSLGCWEPEARRRHDSLLQAYLESRRPPQRLTGAVREPYWLASASNGLSGAIRYHLAILSNPGSPERQRYDSGRALYAWERAVRGAAAVLSTSRGG